ncbi:YkvA family protein [Paenibacillus gorillae]|uniref:YkvA family protein n=1 Tax=Paenibacillus gorillae TaxID=1243662 RepID=UPI0004B27018|nr:YkvA family protein [Paenibacillus gorillae]
MQQIVQPQVEEEGKRQRDEEVVKKKFWSKMKKYASKVPFSKEAVSMYFCAIDAKTPLYAKGIAFGALAYFISPIDAIPDALLGLGFTDDATVIAAAVTAIGKHVNAVHRDKAERFFYGEVREKQQQTDGLTVLRTEG